MLLAEMLGCKFEAAALRCMPFPLAQSLFISSSFLPWIFSCVLFLSFTHTLFHTHCHVWVQDSMPFRTNRKGCWNKKAANGQPALIIWKVRTLTCLKRWTFPSAWICHIGDMSLLPFCRSYILHADVIVCVCVFACVTGEHENVRAWTPVPCVLAFAGSFALYFHGKYLQRKKHK